MAPSLVKDSLSSLILISSAAAASLPRDVPWLVPRALTHATGLTGNWTYLGCYTDSTGSRTLGGSNTAGSTIDAATCTAFCLSKGYIYAGTEYSDECYCGNNIPTTVSTNPDTDCNMACAGAVTESCGGASRISIYWNGTAPPLPPTTNPGPTGWVSLGCYTDSNARTLATGVDVVGGGNNMSVVGCTTSCGSGKFEYAGVEYSGQCFCGNTLDNGGVPATDGCNMLCNGNSSEFCGGANRLNLYQVASTITTSTQAQSSASSSASSSAASSTLSSALSIKPSASGWTSLGCYTDSVGARTLGKNGIVGGGPNNMTQEGCQAGCKAAGYTYAGVEYSGECYCDTQLRNGGGPAPDGNVGCNMACNGDKTEMCGGPNRMNMFFFGSVSTTSSTSSAVSSAVSSAASSAASSTASSVASSVASSTSSSAPSNTPNANGWTSLGCYTDSVGARTLSNNGVVTGGPSNMTQENCQTGCKAAGYIYAGVEYSGECYCDNQLRNSGGPAPDGNVGCNMACNGNQTEMCGGAGRMNLFVFGTPPPMVSGTGATTVSATVAATSTTTTPVATSIPSGWSYAGCYHDNDVGRNMNNQQPDSTTMDVEQCISICAGLGYIVAGIEYADQCFCDKYLHNNASLSQLDSECNMNCAGNANEKCGGPNRISVYNLGNLTILPIPTPQKTNLPGQWKYIGCLLDNFNQTRSLPYQSVFPLTNNASTCLQNCSAFGYASGGLEYGQECYCGDKGGIPAGATFMPESDCNMPCNGGPSYLCGGQNRLSYYEYQGNLQTWNYASGNEAGLYEMFIGGVVIPLITFIGINNKVTFLEKFGTGAPNTTGAYELDPSLAGNFDLAWREMHVKTDIFCSAGLTLPDRAGRQMTVGGWAGVSTEGIRLYIPSGTPGVNGTTDWQENPAELQLQVGRWYPSAMIMANGSILVVGGEEGSNGAPVPSLELLPKTGPVLYMDWLQRTDPYNLYPFLAVTPSGIFVAYYNEARLLDENTFATIRTYPNIPGAVNNAAGGRTYPLEGTMMIMPQYPPYNKEDLTMLICGGSTPFGGVALDNCVHISPESSNATWTLERMPSKRVISCMTALPDGTYLILNGAHVGVAGFGLASDPNLNAVLYDPSQPVNQRMTVMANTTIARLYHSEAILMTDGRVLVSGSDPEDGVNPQEYRVEVFVPPYLLNGAAQPTYTIQARDWVYGGHYTISVQLPVGTTATMRISLIGVEASTHGNTMGQRTFFPAFTCAGSTCTITAPPDVHTCPPGWFKLFVLDGPTPSHAQFVRIGGDPGSLGNWPNLPDFALPGMGSI